MSDKTTSIHNWRFGPRFVRSDDPEAVALAERVAQFDLIDWYGTPDGGGPPNGALERRLIELRSELNGDIPVVYGGDYYYTLDSNDVVYQRIK